jgi:hypothetical protein
MGESELGLVKLFDLPAIPARSLFLATHPDAAARVAVREVADHVASLFSRRRVVPPEEHVQQK